MARKPNRLTVSYSRRALATLDEIWDWNAQKYGRDHAQSYVTILQAKTDKLATEFMRGRLVPTRPEYRYVTIKRRSKGHGHIAIYEVSGEIIQIDYFHTAQDWQQHARDDL